MALRNVECLDTASKALLGGAMIIFFSYLLFLLLLELRGPKQSIQKYCTEGMDSMTSKYRTNLTLV